MFLFEKNKEICIPVFFKDLFLICISVSMSGHICECNWVQKPEDLPEEGATVGCEPSDMGAGNQPQALCKSSVCC